MLLALIKRLKNDVAFRIKFMLTVSFWFNLLYSLFLFIVGKFTQSKWFFVISFYYGIFSVMRFLLLQQLISHKKLRSKIKMMRTCGVFLVLINFVVSVMFFILIREKQVIQHHEITVITMATYTFTALTLAIYNSVKYFKKNDHLHFSVKIIGLISASISLVTLTNTMLATFGSGEELLRSIVMPLLSAAVAIFIILCAILLVRKANFDLRMLNNEQERE